MNEKYTIVYFSGTNGTKYIAHTVGDLLGDSTQILSLDEPIDHDQINLAIDNSRRLVLLYPVYACMPPELVFDWIRNICISQPKEAIVISVSGGGEMYPNTGCRYDAKRALEKKGYTIIYDTMMCLPSNWSIQTNPYTSAWLIKAVPVRLRQIITDIESGVYRTTKNRLDIFRRLLSKLSHLQANIFTKTIDIDDKCTLCGWCEQNCPTNNIVIIDGNVEFKDRCNMCFRCIYGCQMGAMSSKSNQVLEDGYDIGELVKVAGETTLPPIKVCTKGLLWIGVRKYLLQIFEDVEAEQ